MGEFSNNNAETILLIVSQNLIGYDSF